jgi:hypothetical protein
MYRYFQTVSPKKYCRMYIQLLCHGAKLLSVESGEGWVRGKGKAGSKKKKYPNTKISFQIRKKKYTKKVLLQISVDIDSFFIL